ncbi:MAG: diguanylate cyclase/phosphodiesterase with extracellular sensor [Gammaproteobacteria bacterium]|nr:MAG: diguanylate cyclase/phosphodiesterase with extracellular sensor [Gammaproteobacteria bacterium]TND07403.1 MAG: diguanylate cyclase/phosphodiesterase with extracellular sensor [Gammaproteobacteria bacterium]
MTLYRQLVLVVVMLFVLMFAGTYLANIDGTRTFLLTQLESHAQDTATSLGLSLSPAMRTNDVATMQSMVDAIFDRGYYREISVADANGAILVEKKMDVTIEHVPAWFVNWLALETPHASAAVMSGWNPGATVRVHSHPGYAYSELWQTTTRMALWFLLTTIGASITGALILRVLLRPLKTVEQQAEAISARQYDVQGKLPRTRELRNVVLAMNRMAGKIKMMFEELSRNAERFRKLAFEDPVTGLGNRRFLEAQLENILGSIDEHRHGALMLIQLHGLQQLNDRHGYARGDELLKAAANLLANATLSLDRRVLARTTGSDFVLVIPGIDPESAGNVAARLCEKLVQLHTSKLIDSPDVAHLGVVNYDKDAGAQALLAQADQALRTAQAGAPNSWSNYRAASAPAGEMRGRQEWKTQLVDAIKHRRVVLHSQPVVDARNAGRTLHHEVLVRILDSDAQVLPAALFLPLAEQLDMVDDIDRIVIEDALRFATGLSTSVAINLSPASLGKPEFQAWLADMLRQVKDAVPRIVFEVSELGAVRELESIRRFVGTIQGLGHGFALDHFGQAFSSFGYLQSLRPDYVKIDGAYTHNIATNKDNRFYVESLCSVAHSLDILTIAERVENRQQWETLTSLNVDGIQGHVVGKPQDIRELQR